MVNKYSELMEKINLLLNLKSAIIVGIDGRCVSGKTTLASKIQDETGCSVIHADDFFLRPEQRTSERYLEPGGNIDYERMRAEVFDKIRADTDFSYRPFDCSSLSLKEPVTVRNTPLIVIEGTYSMHPDFYDEYDIRVFCDISCETQLHRIEKRNGKNALEIFKSRWIPLEEKYFHECNVREKADYVYVME